MMKSAVARALVLAALLAGSVASEGCAGSAEDTGEDGASALTSGDPRYDAVVAGGTKVDTDATHTADASASTHLIGFVAGAHAEIVEDRVLSFAGWTEIRGPKGNTPFQAAKVVSDATKNGIRTFDVQLTLEKGVTLLVEGTARPGAHGIEVRMTNTTAYRHWLLGTILEAGKLHIAFDIVRYGDGIIVDATMSAKLAKLEDKAADMTGAITLVFAWIKAGARS